MKKAKFIKDHKVRLCFDHDEVVRVIKEEDGSSLVERPKGMRAWVPSNVLEEVKPEVKVGDTIRITSYMFYDLPFGSTHKVETVNPRGKVSFSYGGCGFALSDSFKVVPKETVKVGDKVRIIKAGMGVSMGDVVEVNAIWVNGNIVVRGNLCNNLLQPDQFEVVEEEKGLLTKEVAEKISKMIDKELEPTRHWRKHFAKQMEEVERIAREYESRVDVKVGDWVIVLSDDTSCFEPYDAVLVIKVFGDGAVQAIDQDGGVGTTLGPDEFAFPEEEEEKDPVVDLIKAGAKFLEWLVED